MCKTHSISISKSFAKCVEFYLDILIATSTFLYIAQNNDMHFEPETAAYGNSVLYIQPWFPLNKYQHCPQRVLLHIHISAIAALAHYR